MIRKYDDGKVIIKTILTLAFILFIVGYGFFQAKNIVSGPKIALASDYDGVVMTGDNNMLSISGNAQNISSINLNDRPIHVDESGSFTEKLLLFPGYNTIKLFGEDKFGSTVEKKIEVVYKP